LDSRTFERAPALRSLLSYLWQHRDEPLSEYAIATEALGRSAMFDAKTDATVRVQISRLRQRLDKYYEEEGAQQLERIIIPLGSHQIRLEALPAASVPEPDRDPNVDGQPSRRRTVIYLSAACATLVIVCVCLAVALAASRASARSAGGAVHAPRFWNAFFGNGRRTRIILPTPVFFSFGHDSGDRRSTVMLRDTEINDFANRESSSEYRQLERKLGPSQLATNYTVTSDTFASVRLARYLDHLALPTTVLSAADAPLEALDSENVIALGTWGTLRPLQPYLDRMNYVLTRHEVSVEVRSPLPGEAKSVDLQVESAERSIWPGVLAVLPGRGGNSHLLILAGRHTSALVSFLTSSDGLAQLDRLWKEKGSPEYYEAVVNAEMDGATLVRFWPAAIRAFHP
jgi:Transcriptional regulatory protein, C terminal